MKHRNSCWALLTATDFKRKLILQHLFPVFALLFFGVALKRTGMINAVFSQTSDKLIYYVFFPLMLFWKIGAAPQVFSTDALRFYASAATAVLTLYLLSLVGIKLLRVTDFQAGAFSQSCYRFNTYVGMAVIYSVLGEPGVAQFGVLIGMIIPIINILSVLTLTWFSNGSSSWDRRLRLAAASIIKNPLILGCLTGILYARWINTFPVFIENTFRLAGSVTLPLALISIGGSLSLDALKQHFSRALAASVLKLAVLPLCGFWLMRALIVPQQLLSVGLIFFALPTSTSVYVLSGQLGSDKQFASAAIVLSTGLSFISLSIVLWWHYG